MLFVVRLLTLAYVTQVVKLTSSNLNLCFQGPFQMPGHSVLIAESLTISMVERFVRLMGIKPDQGTILFW